MAKNLPAKAGDACSIPGVGKTPWRRKWQLQYSCLENPMDRGAWQAIVHGVAKSQTQLSDWACTQSHRMWLYPMNLSWTLSSDSPGMEMSESRSLKNRIALQCRNMPKGRGLFGRVKAGRSQDYKKGQGVCFNLRPSPSFYYISTFGGYLMMIYPNPHLSFKTPFVFARVYMARSNLGQSLTCGNLELGQSLHMVRTICNSKARGGQTIQGGPVQFSHSVVSNCL